jgi:hypothetical protein
VHVYVLAQDGSDIIRFLTTLHQRCWLAGLGWFVVGAGGQLLERSIVDRMVGAPERLVFEGAPVLDEPLRQDNESRRPYVFEGSAVDTLTACPPLTIVEQSRLREFKSKAASGLDNERAKVRATFIAAQARKLVETKGISEPAAEQIVKRQCEGVLRPDVVLPFDDEELASCTVADVLTAPDRFVGETLADPLEGPDYGICKAQIMRRADGSLWIHSFAHGRTTYELKLDRAAGEAAMGRVEGEAVARVFLDLVCRPRRTRHRGVATVGRQEVRPRQARTECKTQGGAPQASCRAGTGGAQAQAQRAQRPTPAHRGPRRRPGLAAASRNRQRRARRLEGIQTADAQYRRHDDACP